MKLKDYLIVGFVVLSVSSSLIGIFSTRALRIERDNLVKDKIDLEIELADKDNEIYALNLDLKTTEKTLADTAYELETLANNDLGNLNLDYVGEFNCTAYCCEKYPHICGTGTGKTSSGAPVTPGVSAAVADLETFPYGTVLYIEGVGIRIVQDGGKFDFSKIDIAVDTHEHALNWEGQGKHKVWIVEIEEEKE